MKATLEIDLPDNCEECPLVVNRHNNWIYYCPCTQKGVTQHDTERPPFCPLKIKED